MWDTNLTGGRVNTLCCCWQRCSLFGDPWWLSYWQRGAGIIGNQGFYSYIAKIELERRFWRFSDGTCCRAKKIVAFLNECKNGWHFKEYLPFPKKLRDNLVLFCNSRLLGDSSKRKSHSCLLGDSSNFQNPSLSLSSSSLSKKKSERWLLLAAKLLDRLMVRLVSTSNVKVRSPCTSFLFKGRSFFLPHIFTPCTSFLFKGRCIFLPHIFIILTFLWGLVVKVITVLNIFDICTICASTVGSFRRHRVDIFWNDIMKLSICYYVGVCLYTYGEDLEIDAQEWSSFEEDPKWQVPVSAKPEPVMAAGNKWVEKFNSYRYRVEATSILKVLLRQRRLSCGSLCLRVPHGLFFNIPIGDFLRKPYLPHV